jgi:hypothetical protein
MGVLNLALFGLKIPVLHPRRIRSPDAIKILSLGTIIKSSRAKLWSFWFLDWIFILTGIRLAKIRLHHLILV